jgi:predicted kinase
MLKLEVLIGMIGSGKSTYARSRAAEGAMIVCHDDLTEMLHGQYRYDPGLKRLYLGMMKDLAADVLNGLDVVIDRTHLTREARAVWVEHARSLRRAGPGGCKISRSSPSRSK